jgi:hypothetical protein
MTKILKAPNGGVWCWDKQALLDNNRFTDWKQYGDDIVVEPKNSKTVVGAALDMLSEVAHMAVAQVATPPADVLADGPGSEVELGEPSQDILSELGMSNIEKTTSASIDGVDEVIAPVAKVKAKAKTKSE